jgi:NTE family protein
MMSATSGDLLVGQVSTTGIRSVPQDAVEIEVQAAEIAASHAIERDIAFLPQVTERSGRDWFRPARDGFDPLDLRVHRIRSSDVMADLRPSSRFDTSWSSLTKLRDMGRLAAEIWLHGGIHKIGVRPADTFRASAEARPC